MRRNSPMFAAFATVLGTALTVTACGKKSGGSGGGGTPENPAEVAPQAGTVAIEAEPEAAAPSAPVAPEPGPAVPVENEPALTLAMNRQIAVRPAIAIGTVALELTTETKTELELFKEGRYVWNPANIPLEELNKIVCVLARTGFHVHPNKGQFVARVPMSECFQNPAAAAGGDQGSASTEAPTDVVVETATVDGAIKIKAWFTREISGDRTGTPAMADVFIWEFFETLALDYFVEATVKEIPTNESPFGVFDMKWEMLIKKDGVRDTKPFQQGYVTTERADDQITLTYNQRNWNYDDQPCDARASVTYAGIPFVANNAGTAANGLSLTFDGTSDVQAVLNAAPAPLSAAIDTTVQYNIVLPATTLTLAGGITGSDASVTVDGVTFSYSANASMVVNAGDTVAVVVANHPGFKVNDGANFSQLITAGTHQLTGFVQGAFPRAMSNGIEFHSDYASTDGNGRTVAFDGAKTIQTVMDEYQKTYPGDRLSMFIYPAQMILPAGTATFQGGVVESYASVSITTLDATVVDLRSPVYGTDLNGFRVCFDGVKTVDDVVNDIKLKFTGNPRLFFPFGGDKIPPEGCYTLTGGSGPPKDTWANIREFAANAQMGLASGKPVKGKAHTAENWSRENTTNTCPNRMPSWTPMPASYGLVFDRYDTYPGKTEPADAAARTDFPGRALAKQYNDFVAANAASGFDPNAPRCEQMGGEIANVWGYAVFDGQGKKINHRTWLPLYVDGSTNEWGDGSISEWGTYLWTPASRAYTKEEDGTKRYFDVVNFDGLLIDNNGVSQVFAQASGAARFECVDFCPSGTIGQGHLDHMWDPSYFLYNQEYVYDYATKRLYLDLDKDGGMDVPVAFDSGLQGWFDLRLNPRGDNTVTYRYSLSTYSPTIGLKEGNVFFTPPKRLEFDTSMTYDPATHAYPGTATLNAAHDGQAFSGLIMGSKLTFDYGSLCCFNFEQKSSMRDQWGNAAYAPAVTLKKGAPMRLDPNAGDPDGDGPLTAGMEILVAPSYAELRPITQTDCSAEMQTDIQTVPTDLPLPAPLADATARKVADRLGARPTGTLPVLILNGEPL